MRKEYKILLVGGWLENLTVVAIVAALIGLMAGGIVKLMVKRKE